MAPDVAQGAGPYRFDDVVVDAAGRTVTRAGIEQPLEPKAFAVLLALLEHPGELLPRDDLLDRVWGHRHVTPGVLTRAIAQVRHALGDDPHQPRYVQTRHAVGYRFVGVLEPAPETPSAPVEPALPDPPAADATAAPRPSPATPRYRGRAAAGAGAVLAAALLAWIWIPRPMPAPAHGPASLAVLPFAALGDAADDHWFAEGLSSELQAALSEQPGLRVAAWAPARHAAEDARGAGARLGVGHVLDATVRRSGARVRVSARLVDTRSGLVEWSRSYDRQLRDVFATQADIAANVARELGARLDDEAAMARQLAPTRDVDAFLAYLRGLHLAGALAGDARASQARAAFDDALARDAGFARAQAGICRVELWRFEGQRDAAGFEAARSACERAHNMDPANLSVRLLLGDVLRLQGHADRAAAEYRAALDMPALRARALLGLAKLDIAANRVQPALARLREAAAADRTDARLLSEVSYQAYVLGEVPLALDYVARATRLAPGDAQVWSLHGALLLTAGRNEEAASSLQRALAIEPSESVLSNLGMLRYEAGDYAAAVGLYRRAVELYPGNFQLHANLAEALWANPATRAQAGVPYQDAVRLAESYIALNPSDAKAIASLGSYRAALGQRERALASVARSEALDRDLGDVAFLNAQTFGFLGRTEDARRRVAIALREGIPHARIGATAALKQAGIAADATPPPAATAPLP